MNENEMKEVECKVLRPVRIEGKKYKVGDKVTLSGFNLRFLLGAGDVEPATDKDAKLVEKQTAKLKA